MRTRLIETIRTISADRHKLVILLGQFGIGKTGILRDVATEIDGKYVNLNLELTERLLTLPRRKYDDGVTAHKLIDELCDELSPDHEPLLIDNIEILFSPELGKLNPIDTFKRISRQRPVVLALPARRVGNHAEYATIGQADHLKMSLAEFVYLEMDSNDT
ncbi:MAG: BREX-3 system P-loop-containing protein BrxF [Anaerolineae bacterium]|nr:BREX-3 system P-loop-containing protein BrxF [Anaerolineae bacterium]